MRFAANNIRNLCRSYSIRGGSGGGATRKNTVPSSALRSLGSLPSHTACAHQHQHPQWPNNKTLPAAATFVVASTILASSVLSQENNQSKSSAATQCERASPPEQSSSSSSSASSSSSTNTGENTSAFAKPSKDIKTIYKLGEIIGEGGFGQVYHATRLSDKTNVALKCIPKAWTLRDEFQREVDVLQKLSSTVGGPHPHICRMYDIYEGEDEYWMAMELIEGGELFEHLIEEGAYSEGRAAVFMRQFAEALSFVHKAGVVHGDLKPENLLLSSWDNEEAELKVVDFGCATILDNDSSSGGDDEQAAPHSTLAYDPPEKLMYDSPPSFQSDVWAAGCILYIILTGSHPFDKTGSSTDEEISARVKSIGTSEDRLSELAFSDERSANLSPSVTSLLWYMLHPDPTKRTTSERVRRNRWVQGLTASWNVLDGIDSRLERFWQKEFRGNMLKRFGSAVTEEQLKSVFTQIDEDGNGNIEQEELAKVLRESGAPLKHIESIFDAINLDHDKGISFDEFRSVMKNELPAEIYQTKFRNIIAKELQTDDKNQRSEPLRAAARRLFNSMDLDQNGSLDCHELRLVLRKLGVDEKEISLLVASVDLNHDGLLTFDEFSKVLSLSKTV